MSKLDEIEETLDDINKPKKKEEDNKTLLYFFLGILLIGVGIFVVLQNTTVSTRWYTWRLGSFGVPTGATVIPLLIGVGIMFYNPKSIIGKIVIGLGFAFVLITIILSVDIRFNTTSLFVYILMVGSIFAGVGLLLRAIFKKSKK